MSTQKLWKLGILGLTLGSQLGFSATPAELVKDNAAELNGCFSWEETDQENCLASIQESLDQFILDFNAAENKAEFIKNSQIHKLFGWISVIDSEKSEKLIDTSLAIKKYFDLIKFNQTLSSYDSSDIHEKSVSNIDQNLDRQYWNTLDLNNNKLMDKIKEQVLSITIRMLNYQLTQNFKSCVTDTTSGSVKTNEEVKARLITLQGDIHPIVHASNDSITALKDFTLSDLAFNSQAELNSNPNITEKETYAYNKAVIDAVTNSFQNEMDNVEYVDLSTVDFNAVSLQEGTILNDVRNYCMDQNVKMLNLLKTKKWYNDVKEMNGGKDLSVDNTTGLIQ